MPFLFDHLDLEHYNGDDSAVEVELVLKSYQRHCMAECPRVEVDDSVARIDASCAYSRTHLVLAEMSWRILEPIALEPQCLQRYNRNIGMRTENMEAI